MKQSERNFWLDAGLFVTFLAAGFSGIIVWLLIPHLSEPVLLGFNRQFWLTVHVGSGLAGTAGAILHIQWHRAWLKAMRTRPIASLPIKLRTNRVTDRIVWIAFLAASLSGLTGWIGNGADLFIRLHVVFALIWLLGITAHLVFHRKWIAAVAGRLAKSIKEQLVSKQPDALKG
jgi:hypothetical protein